MTTDHSYCPEAHLQEQDSTPLTGWETTGVHTTT